MFLRMQIYEHIEYDVKIKICAEYWNMLPRPNLACQEPDLREAADRRPGIPGKTSRDRDDKWIVQKAPLKFTNKTTEKFNHYLHNCQGVGRIPLLEIESELR